MRTVFRYIISALFLITLAGSCKRTSQPAAPPEQPYPSVADQRLSLAAKPPVVPVRLLDSIQMIQDLEYLASPVCEGRRPGSNGHAKARERLLKRMREAGVDSFQLSLQQDFVGKDLFGTTNGHNVVGWVKGTAFPQKYIVITAHYDHLGMDPGNSYYPGADDNASGVACLLALAKYFQQHPSEYSLVFAALDREETGLEGAYNFVNKFINLVSLSSVRFNVNLDMIARSDRNEIFAAGIKHYPQFINAINEVQYKTNVDLLMGHDQGLSGDDWTLLSDHGAFHEREIPFIYLGVEDHADYHRPTDTAGKINYSSYIENCNMVLLLVNALKP